jgi:hypothetical protein
MPQTKLQFVSFGAARALTRDQEVGDLLEMQIFPSRTVAG